MKRFLIIFFVIFLFDYPGQSARIITNFDIARWYLDSDLVLICTINEIVPVLIDKHDTLLSNQIHESWEVIREKYIISMDSIIKTGTPSFEIPNMILTPNFLTNYSKTQTIGKEFSGFDSNGDSTFNAIDRLFNDDAYFDYSYFKLNLNERYLVILNKTELGYVIEYGTICNKSTLDLILEIKTKGNSYFPH
jgi:hypothetical protein